MSKTGRSTVTALAVLTCLAAAAQDAPPEGKLSCEAATVKLAAPNTRVAA